MAVPTSASTDAELWEAYDDGASYDITESVALAQQFIVACRLILRRRPQSVSGDGTSATFADVSKQLRQAEIWIAGRNLSTSAASGPRYLDFRGLRD